MLPTWVILLPVAAVAVYAISLFAVTYLVGVIGAAIEDAFEVEE